MTCNFPVRRAMLVFGADTIPQTSPKGYTRLLFSLPLAELDFLVGIKSLLKNFRTWANASDTKYRQIPDDLPVHVI